MRIVQKNNWGHVFYETTTGEASPVSVGDDIMVEWPDGTHSRERVAAKKDRVKIADQGHENEVERTFLGLNCNHHGVSVWIPIESIEITSFIINPKPEKKTLNDRRIEAEAEDRRREGVAVGYVCTCGTGRWCLIHS